jgi:two-component system, response regulator RegA
MTHMLFVEDDEALAFVTKRSLEKRGYTVHWFSNLRDARAQLSEFPLDYALLDLKVGKDSSLEFIGQVKQAHPKVPIVLITGYGSIATAVQAMKLGAVNYLTKPCSVEQILAALKNESTSTVPEDSAEIEALSLRRVEWETIQRALDDNDGNISAAARQLKMHRRTLQRKLQKRPSK